MNSSLYETTCGMCDTKKNLCYGCPNNKHRKKRKKQRLPYDIPEEDMRQQDQ